ncbi:MAG: enoyl-CoA hydratase/isomerase family protein [Mycobacterium sp.]
MTGHAAELSDANGDVLYRTDGHLAYITLNRPDRGNAFSPQMKQLLEAAWVEVKRDPEVRCVIVTGSGDRHFCTGADVSRVASAGHVAAGNGPMSDEIRVSPHQNRVWKPVIAAVNGLVNGAGLHLVVDADIIIAAEHAAFMDTHTSVGMVGGVENIGLAKRLPLGQALRMTMQGRSYRLSARRAYELGMVDEIVPAADLMSTAESIARDITANSPEAISLSKQAIWGSLETGYRDSQEYGWALLRMHWAHPDSAEGPRAHAEKRPPNWQT